MTSRAGERVTKFLCDLQRTCTNVADFLKPNGVAIFVVSRRRVDSQLLYLDRFLIEILGRRDVNLTEQTLRCMVGKRTPLLIRSKARTRAINDTPTSFTPTMTVEIVQIFRKGAPTG
jgi:hypothetical protein